MPATEIQVAEVLEGNLARLATAAARRLAGRRDSTGGDDEIRRERWVAHYAQRLRELAVALRYDEPDLFLSELVWSRIAFQSRQTPSEELQSSLDCLRDTLEEELTPELASVVRDWTDRRVDELSVENADAPAFHDSDEDRLALSYLELLLDGERQSAIRLVLRAVDEGLTIDQVCDGVLLPVQRQVGAMWHQNEIAVAQEHFVTDTTTSILAMLAGRAPMPDTNGCTAMLCTAQGNAHDLGSRFVGDAFERAGWNVIFLGADLPRREIVLGVEAFGPDLVALAASLAVHVPNIAATIEAIRGSYPEVRILVGGRVFRQAPELASKIGADAGAVDVHEALEVAADLVGLRSADA